MRGGAATARPCNFPRSGTESPAARRRIKWDPGARTRTEAKEIPANKNRSTLTCPGTEGPAGRTKIRRVLPAVHDIKGTAEISAGEKLVSLKLRQLASPWAKAAVLTLSALVALIISTISLIINSVREK